MGCTVTLAGDTVAEGVIPAPDLLPMYLGTAGRLAPIEPFIAVSCPVVAEQTWFPRRKPHRKQWIRDFLADHMSGMWSCPAGGTHNAVVGVVEVPSDEVVDSLNSWRDPPACPSWAMGVDEVAGPPSRELVVRHEHALAEVGKA